MNSLSPRARLVHDESGWAVITAIIVMSLMLGIGLAAIALTDGQTKRSGTERVRESSFNLAEGALSQQSFLLGGKGWPRTAVSAPPTVCNQTSTNSRCPTPAALVPSTGTGAYAEPDYATGTTWSTTIRDNLAANNQTYSSAVNDRPTWDQNGDAYIWVRSTATVRSKTRTLVALLKRDSIPILLPKAVLVAGSVNIGQNGQAPVITSDATAPVILRCPNYGNNCNDAISKHGDTQISPNNVTYTPGLGSFVPSDTLDKLIDSATTFSGATEAACPSAAQVSGLVVIDVPDTVTCKLTGNATFNSPAAPGILIMRRGTLEYRGNADFYGLILHLNEGNRNQNADPCVDITGNPNITGGVIIEGHCAFRVQGHARLIFNPNMFNASVTGVAGLVQNTFRELPPGS